MLTMRSPLRRRPHPLLAAVLRRRVLLVAHPCRAGELLAWISAQRRALCDHQLFADDATRASMGAELRMAAAELRSFAPERGRHDTGRCAAADLLVLFWDPDEAQPRDPQVRALLASAVRHGLSLACTRRAADYLLLTAPRHDELVRLLPYLDERRWAPELAITTSGPAAVPSHLGEAGLAETRRHGAMQRCP